MRIAIDTTALPRQPVGAGKYIIELVRALGILEKERPSGHEFIVFAHQHGQALIAGGQEQLPDPGTPAGPTSGLRWVVLPEKSPAQRLIWEQTAFPWLLRRLGVDLLHSMHYTRPAFLPCASVVTFHDMTFFLYPHLHTRAKRLFFPRAIRFSARRADALLAISESTRQDAIRLLHIPPEKITATPLGVTPQFRPITDPEKLQAVRERYNLPEHFLLYVGLVEPRKNLPLLLRAYDCLVREQGDIPPLVIVGRPGWGYAEVLAEIERRGLKEKVHFTGYLPLEELPIVYNLADIFIYPTIYEGFGLPPLEALACGAPVITSAVSSLPEHIGKAGLLVPPQDEGALAQAIGSVLSDPALAIRLKRLGPQQASQFTWQRTAQETLQVYQRVLANR